ncbi:torsin interacting protein [Haematobia irritans]|uniref:Uncharacterized protein n=1 Tax=Haematobia irritans TaxID=7368 RepID=A0A1L8ECA0_HAEIR
MSENIKVTGRRSIHRNENSNQSRDVSPDPNEIGDSQAEYDSTGEYSASDFEDYERGVSLGPKEIRESFNMSRSVPRTPQRPKISKTSSYMPEDTIIYEPQSSSMKIFSPWPLTILIVIFSALSGVYVLGNGSNKRLCTFDSLQTQYPSQDSKVWQTLKFGIESILNKERNTPVVYLFAHYGDNQMHEIVKDIASHTSHCFGKEMNPVEMNKEDFTSFEAKTDYGTVIEKYKLKIKEGRVILIANLNEIPAEAARAFHAICDAEDSVVVFLTMIIPQVDHKKVDKIAENTLNELWGSSLERNELDPLIIRVTDQVIFLKT